MCKLITLIMRNQHKAGCATHWGRRMECVTAGPSDRTADQEGVSEPRGLGMAAAALRSRNSRSFRAILISSPRSTGW